MMVYQNVKEWRASLIALYVAVRDLILMWRKRKGVK